MRTYAPRDACANFAITTQTRKPRGCGAHADRKDRTIEPSQTHNNTPRKPQLLRQFREGAYPLIDCALRVLEASPEMTDQVTNLCTSLIDFDEELRAALGERAGS